VIDTRSIAIGTVIGSGAALLLGWAALHSDSNSGPTAGALSDGVYMLLATTLGVFLAGGIGAGLSRGVAPVLTGTLSVAATFVLVLSPVAVLTESSDVALSERVGDAVAVFLVMFPIGIIGALVGWFAGRRS
jgi:hypothetical protein